MISPSNSSVEFKNMRLNELINFNYSAQSILRYMVYFLIFFSIFYQIYLISSKYIPGKTIININFGRHYDQTLPAITFCFPQFFSMERTAKSDPDIIQMNQMYQNLIRNDILKADKLYFEYHKNYTENLLKNQPFMNVLFDKMNLKIKALDGKKLFSLSLWGDTNMKNIPADFRVIIWKIDNLFRYVGDPLETIFIGAEKIKMNKCFTFFSSAQKQWRDFHAQVKMLVFRFDWNKVLPSFPINILNTYHLAIHSPNHLPHLDDNREFMTVKFNDQVIIKYIEYRIQMLENGHDTNCHSYESDTHYGYYRMSSDCVSDCYQITMRQLCKVNNGYFMSPFLLRKDYFMKRNDTFKYCQDPGYNKFIFIKYLNCVKSCKVECNFKYYPLIIEKSQSSDPALFIIHNIFPDILFNHVPQMNLVGFICNLGGIFGMWFGMFYLVNKIVFAKNRIYNICINRQENNLTLANPVVRRW